MPITNKKIVILRAGVVTKDSIRKGAESVDTVDKVYNLSVQATKVTGRQDAGTIALLLANVPNPHYALTFSGSIMDKGGTIDYNALPGNPYHALVSNITVDELFEIFKINKH